MGVSFFLYTANSAAVDSKDIYKIQPIKLLLFFQEKKKISKVIETMVRLLFEFLLLTIPLSLNAR